MPWWLWELLRSFKFLSASGQEGFWRSKRIYELVIPLVISGSSAAVYVKWPAFFQTDLLSKFSASLFQFMVFVVPFHLAALAAIATFARSNMDKPLRGADVSIRVWDNADSQYFYKSLTLRQYTCLLFGYLCSIGLTFIVIFVLLSGLNLEWLLGDWVGRAKQLTFFLLMFFLAHYATLTVYAITFLFDKVNGIDEK
ncbi:hypothetical protein [Rhizobium ruizarguesonis]|uniref:hypothetical protein n=1 Tax=Rhizobium ruizarguesonis TaxID=2081791 RepID=UPI0010312B35|nr:hypothetical protein [Rhizobium ruizarguesonis]TBA34796.1 hypothetical protein ELH63_29945 [Rhizobium ruizarguesonis]